MRLPERENFLVVLAIPLIAVGLSSITLWLLESPLKFPLFTFEVALILFLCLAYLDPSPRQLSVKTRGVSTVLDYLFFAASFTLLLLVVFDSYSIVNQVLTIAVCFFLPGYTLLRFIRFRPLHTWVEKLVLSMVLSIPISSLIYTFMLILIPSQERALALAPVYVLISLSLILWSWFRRSETDEEPHHYSVNVMDAAILVTILSFVTYVLSVTYPQLAYLAGADIVRHFSAAQVVNAAPDLYRNACPWFHFQWAQIQLLAKQPVAVFQSSMAYLSLIVILSFYIMAKAYLRGVGHRLPILATVFFSLFSGFGWVYFLKEKLAVGASSTQWDLLHKVNDISYWDIMYGQGPQLWMTYRPWTLGITLFLVLLYLLKRHDLSKRTYILLFSLSVVTLGMIHMPELIPFVALLFVLALFNPKIELNLGTGIPSTIIGISAVVALKALYEQALGSSIKLPYAYLAVLGAVLLIAYSLARFGHRPTIGASIRKASLSAMHVLVLVVSLFSVALLLTWLSMGEPFSAQQVTETLSVPWMLYPVLLGVGGLLGLAGLTVVVRDYRSHPIVIFAYLFVIALFIARSLDFFNVRLMSTGYWEVRMIVIIYLASSVLAGLALVKVGELLHGQTLTRLCVAPMIIVLLGFTSTILAPEFYYYQMPRTVLGAGERDAVTYLSSTIENDPRAPVWTVSDRSVIEAQYSSSPRVAREQRSQLWSSLYPELTLNLLPVEEQMSPPYFYLHERDLNILGKEYSDSYLARHLLPSFPNIYRGSQTAIYQTPNLTTPRLQSDTVLLIPITSSDDYLFVYDMLSLGGWDYTTYLESDPNAEGEIFIIPYDKPYNQEKLSGKKIVIVNTNGYGPYAERVFEGKSTGESRATGIISDRGEFDFPESLTIPHLKAKNGFETVAEYVCEEGERVVLALRGFIDGSEVTYLNAYPLVKQWAIESEFGARASAPTKDLLVYTGLSFPRGTYGDIISYLSKLMFKEAVSKGNVQIVSPSVVFSPLPSAASVQVRAGETTTNYAGVVLVEIKGADRVTISTTSATLGQGRGFYTCLSSGESAISANGENIVLSLELADGQSVKLNASSHLEFRVVGDHKVYLRTPQVKVDGEVRFNSAYAYRGLKIHPYPSGQDLIIEGHVEFSIPLSDTYSMAQDFTYSGSVEREPPIYQRLERQDFKNALPWVLILLLFTIFSYIINQFGKAREERVSNSLNRTD